MPNELDHIEASASTQPNGSIFLCGILGTFQREGTSLELRAPLLERDTWGTRY